jgi:hypothetical protein
MTTSTITPSSTTPIEPDPDSGLYVAVRETLDHLVKEGHIQYGFSDWGSRMDKFYFALNEYGQESDGLNAAFDGLPQYVRIKAEAIFNKHRTSKEFDPIRRISESIAMTREALAS